MRRAMRWIEPRRHDGVRWAVLALLVTVIAHQFVMLAPVHEHGMPVVAQESHTATATDAHECKEPCLPTTMRECAAIVAALRVVAALAFVFVVLALLLPSAPHSPWMRIVPHESLWPPSRCRAFLQVFLC